MEYSWHDLLGNMGVIVILATYLLLQLERVAVTNPSYSIVNGIGAAFILISLVSEFNLSAFIIEAAWLLISLFGLLRCLAKGGPRTEVDQI
jgi:hypothetical protein